MMNWVGFWSVFILGMFKFMISTIPGPRLEMSFFQTWLASFLGAVLSSALFYFGSEIVMALIHRRRLKKRQAALEAGQQPINYYKVTRTKKFIIQIKHRFGFYGITLFAPLLFSVPIGSYVAAKFYGKLQTTFVFVVLGLAANAFLLTLISYAFH
ncbi:MAG: hypothetical protein RLZZ65_1532 [Bacteroidota bacterium]|jgi:hypothetical protein